jgi:preprotein translocase subunit YajC
MLSQVRRGDRVVMGGGIMGSVTKVIDDSEVMVEIADGVKVRVQRSLLAHVIAKTDPSQATLNASNDDGQKKGGLLSGLFGGQKK